MKRLQIRKREKLNSLEKGVAQQPRTPGGVEISRRPILSRHHMNWWTRQIRKREIGKDKRVSYRNILKPPRIGTSEIKKAHRVGDPNVLTTHKIVEKFAS